MNIEAPRCRAASTAMRLEKAWLFEAECQNRTFNKFSLLPIEIRRIIWEYAVPYARRMFGFIVICANFELARPRAIVPASLNFDRRTLGGSVGALQSNDKGDELVIGNFHKNKVMILNLLHASRESREITRHFFRLDCDSIIPGENISWWHENDVLYVTKHRFTDDTIYYHKDYAITDLCWLTSTRESVCPHLIGVKHIALHCTRQLLQSFSLLDGNANRSFADLAGTTWWEHCFLQNMPSLATLTLLFDPGRKGRLTKGTIKLYEPYDVIVEEFNRTPDELKNKVIRRLEEMARSAQPNRTIPEVKCAVMCWKKPKGYQALNIHLDDSLEISGRQSDGPADLDEI